MSLIDIGTRLWSAHKLKYNVILESAEEERRRIDNFTKNHTFIQDFNLSKSKYHYCGHNSRSHWSYEEYLAWLTHKSNQSQPTFKLSMPFRSKASETLLQDEVSLADPPSFIDWKARKKVTGIKDQGSCGSCWAFSVAASIESAYAIKTYFVVDYSVQQLLDCDIKDYGCGGGFTDVAFQYIVDNGIMTWKDYPYQGVCRYNPKKTIRVSSFKRVQADEIRLMEACATNGPISIVINASAQSFLLYKSGIYYDPLVPPHPLNHAVLLIGYGSTDNTNYWYVKNCWGDSWGELGYVYIMRNSKNYLGVDSLGMFPVL